MSQRKQKIEELEYRIRASHKKESQSENKIQKLRWIVSRWTLMLYWKFLKDDISVRAESLAFLMTFSLLPLLAGVFFVISIFTKFGMVQEAVGELTGRFLENFPNEHRAMIEEYVLKFKDAYLESLSAKSGSLGIFALIILFWVGLRTFNNMDRTLNFIWFSERGRPFIEKVRNFIVVAVGAPFVIIGSLSIPIILQKTPGTREFFQNYSFIKTLLNFIIPFVLTWGVFSSLYKVLPVRRVHWKSAIWAGSFSALLLYLANAALNIYFKFGTTSIYGKAAIVPLMGLWIYWVWIIVILGAEVSYLIQNQQYLYKVGRKTPSFFEGECLLAVLVYMQEAHNQGTNPVRFESLFHHTLLDSDSLRRIIRYLEKKGIVIQCASDEDSIDTEYTLSRDISTTPVRELLEDYLIKGRPNISTSKVEPFYDKSLAHWLNFFGDRSINEFVNAPAKVAFQKSRTQG